MAPSNRIATAIVVRAALALLAAVVAAPASAQLRIVDYNIAQNYDIAADPGGLDLIFAAIGSEVRNGFARPIDVLTVQEMDDDGSDGPLLASILNGVYGVNTYTAAPVPAGALSGGNGLPGLVYNSASVSLLSTIAFGDVGDATTQQPRSSLRFQLRPVGYDAAADFYLYSDHYKSDDGTIDQNRRNIEALAVRANSDALGEGTHAIYAGDFNVYRSTEAMYQTLLSAGPGQAFDPINTPGSWSAPSFGETIKHVHTQSPATQDDPKAFPGQVTGGMDSRFDFQLITGELLDDEGMSYLSGSYHVFGNNGTHVYSEAIDTGTGAAPEVLAALTQSSDHLPVVADYQLPAKLGVQVASIPTSVTLGSAIPVNVLVSNLAAALTALGADELDYTLSVSGDLIGGATGVDLALGGGNSHQIALNTSSLGTKSGVITVSSSSQGAANSLFTMPVSFVVGGGGTLTRIAIAKDDFDAPVGLIGYSQSPAAPFSNVDDGFGRYQVGVSASIPADLIDQTTSTNPSDTWGIYNRATKTDGWFGLADTLNPENPSGDVTASWQFDVAGASSLEVSIDMGAMGDFELADVFNWTYSVDGGDFKPLFTSFVDEDASANYTLANGSVRSADDPLKMSNTAGQTVQLSNIVQTLTSPITELGSLLTIRLQGNTNGDDEAYAFDNIVITGLVAGFAESDFNEDGLVDADDLIAWRTNVGLATGASKSQGDADEDGDVDGTDFLVWQRQLSPPTIAASVPEPRGIILGAWCAALSLPLMNRLKARRI